MKDMFAETDTPPHNWRDTSYAAARSIMGTKRNQDCYKILDLVYQSGSTGMTTDQLELAAGLLHQTCSARVNDLVTKIGILIDSGQRRLTSHKRHAIVWIIATPAQLAETQKSNAVKKLNETTVPLSVIEAMWIAGQLKWDYPLPDHIFPPSEQEALKSKDHEAPQCSLMTLARVHNPDEWNWDQSTCARFLAEGVDPAIVRRVAQTIWNPDDIDAFMECAAIFAQSIRAQRLARERRQFERRADD